jgi:hypothetical protein
VGRSKNLNRPRKRLFQKGSRSHGPVSDRRPVYKLAQISLIASVSTPNRYVLPPPTPSQNLSRIVMKMLRIMPHTNYFLF